MGQDALPGRCRLVQRPHALALLVARLGFSCEAHVVPVLGWHVETAASRGRLQFLPEVRPFSQGSLQVLRRTDFYAGLGQFPQDLAHFRRQATKRLGIFHSVGRHTGLFRERFGDAGLPAAAQQVAVFTEALLCLLVAPRLRSGDQLGQQPAGLVP